MTASVQGPAWLAACPFCGKAATIERDDDDPSSMFVRCHGCGATLGPVFEDSPCADEDTPAVEVMLTGAWNHRISVAAPRAEPSEAAIDAVCALALEQARRMIAEDRVTPDLPEYREVIRERLRVAYRVDGVASAPDGLCDCGCQRSDAWRCARGRRLSTIACHCQCHHYVHDGLSWEDAKARAALGSAPRGTPK